MTRKTSLLLLAILSLLLLTGCAKPVSELTADDSYVGKTVTIKGDAQGVIKIGAISGYTLIDSNGDAIIVSTDDLPAEGDRVTAKGTLTKGPLGIGYYIDEE